MKVYADVIEVVAWFDFAGIPRPLRFRHQGNVVRVERIQEIREGGAFGKRTKIYRCQSTIGDALRIYELKYEQDSCKWYLWKM